MDRDNDPSPEDFERMINHEEMVWECWYRLFVYNVLMMSGKTAANARLYQEYFRKRANRSPEDWYGTPED